MAKKDSVVRAAILIALTVGMRLDAQVVEQPIPFDSAGHVRTVTPGLAARLRLMFPAWPIQGDFVQARLFTVSTGGTVLVAERLNGTFERYALADESRDALRATVDAAMLVIGARVGEDRPDLVSEPARGAFLRNQMLIAGFLYGPLIASLTDDAQTGTALYLASVGGSYFALNGMSKTTMVTRAQNDMATDGALRGAGTAVGLFHTFADENTNSRTYSAMALGGAVVGSAVGYLRGRGLTDSEAHSAMKFSTFAAGTAAGIAGATGMFDGSEGSQRLAAGITVAAGLAGYALGPIYPRRARYTVTSGDVKLLPIGALLGVMAGATPFIDEGDGRAGAASATAGGLLGLYIAERAWARAYDHSTGDVTQTWLGTIAGGLLGGAVIVLAEPDNGTAALGVVTGGALLGAVLGHSMATPARASSRSAFRFSPENLVFAAARVPGQHGVVSLRF